MGQTDERWVASGRPASGLPAVALPDELTWSATLDPHDGTREVEITEEMVRHAIAAMEREQIFPFGAEAGPPPVARAVRKADVIAFPSRER